MNIVEMYEMVKGIYEANQDEYYHIGIRFEDKEREIGDICECSKNNGEREDEREFPAYGTDEYDEMDEFDGASAWDLSNKSAYEIKSFEDLTDDCTNHFYTARCYIVAGDNTSNHDDGLDYHEIVITDATVIAKIF